MYPVKAEPMSEDDEESTQESTQQSSAKGSKRKDHDFDKGYDIKEEEEDSEDSDSDSENDDIDPEQRDFLQNGLKQEHFSSDSCDSNSQVDHEQNDYLSNGIKEEPTSDTEEPSPSNKRSKAAKLKALTNFQVNQQAIFQQASSSTSLFDAIPDLADLGVRTIEQDKYEAGVIQQLEHALKVESEEEDEEEDGEEEGEEDARKIRRITVKEEGEESEDSEEDEEESEDREDDDEIAAKLEASDEEVTLQSDQQGDQESDQQSALPDEKDQRIVFSSRLLFSSHALRKPPAPEPETEPETAAGSEQKAGEEVGEEAEEEAEEDDEDFDYDYNDLAADDSDYSPPKDDEDSRDSLTGNQRLEESLFQELFEGEDDCDKFEEAPETPFVPVRKRWKKGPLAIQKTKKTTKADESKRIVDDGCLSTYKRRLAKYRLFLHESQIDQEEDYNELHTIEENFRIPKRIWNRLFKHQKECLRWLWGIHRDHCGGIIGDEMGLGKTIQIIAFLIALKHSKSRLEFGERYRSLGPVLIVCPATVMHQWVHEIHSWWPEFRVSILHSTGSYSGKRKKMVSSVFHEDSIVITTYQGVVIMKEDLVDLDWHYVVLDEGHKIRNPDAQATKAVKLFNTQHRIILSGSPIQNNLRELWSLFDFVFPGKLGELNTFMSTVATPIRHGAYATASDLQIQVAYKCTLMLRDTIKPYLLRRAKDDVKLALNLPAKSEQVLFCKLTDRQKDIYREYLASSFVQDMRQGLGRLFAALIKIRKICNHPHLFAPWSTMHGEPDFDDLEFYSQAGKMSVVNALLKLWHKQKHKVLLFTQSKQMLDLMEKFVQLKEYSYLRMDGTTTLKQRQASIRRFNEDENVFVFILTTKVGGLGVNLIGGNRVIIYDPDWNPCTDIQARERCWRIGQQKDVIIYRLLCAGTVEEKIYHRQIYKQYLTNSVLKNPHHRRFFKMNDLYDLFTLSEDNDTELMFKESKVKFDKKPKLPVNKYSAQDQSKKGFLGSSGGAGSKMPKIQKKAGKVKEVKDRPEKEEKEEGEIPEVKLSDAKIQELREKARLLSQKLFQNGEVLKKPPEEPKDKDKKTDKKKDKEKKRKKGLKFEGKRIEYLVKQEDFVDEDEEEEKERKRKKDKEKEKVKDKGSKEDYLLSKLMGKKQLDVVLQHDTIENVNTPDHYFIEKEAEKIANEALEKLRRSAEELQNNGQNSAQNSAQNRPFSAIFQPSTSASSSGYSSASTSGLKKPENDSKFSSANLIAALKNRNKTSLTAETGNGKQSFFAQHEESENSNSQNSQNSGSFISALASGSGSKQAAAAAKKPVVREVTMIQDDFEMMQELKNFVNFKGKKRCQAKTHEILDYFNGKIPPAKSAVFRSMLKKLCFKEQHKKGHAVWRLKPEFQA